MGLIFACRPLLPAFIITTSYRIQYNIYVSILYWRIIYFLFLEKIDSTYLKNMPYENVYTLVSSEKKVLVCIGSGTFSRISNTFFSYCSVLLIWYSGLRGIWGRKSPEEVGEVAKSLERVASTLSTKVATTDLREVSNTTLTLLTFSWAI